MLIYWAKLRSHNTWTCEVCQWVNTEDRSKLCQGFRQMPIEHTMLAGVRTQKGKDAADRVASDRS